MRPVCICIAVATVLLLGTLTSAQPGPYPLWSAPSSVRTTGPSVGYGGVYAMPFEFDESGTLPFMLTGWNASTGETLFTIPFTSFDNNNTGDWEGITPAVTLANLAPSGHTPKNRPVVLYGFHLDNLVRAVDGYTGEHLWHSTIVPTQCGQQDCQLTGLSAPVEGSFIVEQASFLVRLDAATGNVVWNVSVSGNDGNPGSGRSHVTADDSAAFMYTTRDHINRVDFYTGGFLYSATVSLGGCTWDCTVSDYTPVAVTSDYAVVGGWTFAWGQSVGVVACLWKRTGAVKWMATPAHYMWSVAANDNVVVANPGELDYENSNGTFTGFDTTTGQQLWAVNATSNYFTDVVMDSATGYVMSASTSGFTQTLYVWDGANGNVIGTMGTSIGGNRAFARDGAVAYVSLSNDDGAGFGVDAIYFGNGTNAPLRTA
jgi:hypothetical protein